LPLRQVQTDAVQDLLRGGDTVRGSAQDHGGTDA
jgi:hypothetical protein